MRLTDWKQLLKTHGKDAHKHVIIKTGQGDIRPEINSTVEIELKLGLRELQMLDKFTEERKRLELTQDQFAKLGNICPMQGM